MDRRQHIIYCHPAEKDGYDFFYIYYFPGSPRFYLRCKTNGKVREISTASAEQMLHMLEESVASRNGSLSPSQRAPFSRAAKMLRLRLKHNAEYYED